MGSVPVGAGRLSTIAIASALRAALPAKNADALGILPRGEPRRGGPNCFGRGTLILTAHGEVPVESLANGALVMTTNGALPVKWVGRQTFRRNASASWHRSGCHASRLMIKLRSGICIYRRNTAF